MSGQMKTSAGRSQPTLTSDILLKRFSIKLKIINPGLVSNKNIPCFKLLTNSLLSLLVGQPLVSQDLKDHTTAQLELTIVSVEQSWMLTTKLVFIQVSRSLEQMLRSCQDSGNFRLVLVKASRLEITYGSLDIFLVELQKTSIFLSLSHLSSSENGMALVAIPTSLQSK
jgi:hypothetical protein